VGACDVYSVKIGKLLPVTTAMFPCAAMPGSTRQAEAPRSRRGLRSNTFRPPSCKKRGVGVVPGTDIVDELRTELHVLILC